jgi:integrase
MGFPLAGSRPARREKRAGGAAFSPREPIMASLFRPKIVTYTLGGSHRTPDGKRVTKDTPGAVRSESRSKKWYGRIPGQARPVPLSESKETARRMLNKLRGDAELGAVGLTDPYADHRDRPLKEHLEDFRRYLAAKGNVAEHVNKTVAQCHAVIEGCRFKRMADVQPSAVVEFLAGLRRTQNIDLDTRKDWWTVDELASLCGIAPASVRRLARRGMLAGEGEGKEQSYPSEAVAALLRRRGRGVGVETSNHNLASIRAFTKWLVKDRRSGVDPLTHLSRQNADVDVRHQRRALREESFHKVIEATGAGRPFRGLTGADRLVIYTLSANTGLRASELGSLTPGSFALDATPPTVTVQAGYSKHRREDVQPLRADVAQMMRQYIAGRPAERPLWPGTWTEAGAEMVRFDLAAAGIPYQDDAGRYFDFHALRGQFISFLAATGVHPKVAQVLARHSTITLTMDYYTHLDVLDVSGALDKLPSLSPGSRAERPSKGKGRPTVPETCLAPCACLALPGGICWPFGAQREPG